MCASCAYDALFGHRIVEDEFDGHWLNEQTKDTLDISAHQQMKPVSLVAVILGLCDGVQIARCMALFLCMHTNRPPMYALFVRTPQGNWLTFWRKLDAARDPTLVAVPTSVGASDAKQLQIAASQKRVRCMSCCSWRCYQRDVR